MRQRYIHPVERFDEAPWQLYQGDRLIATLTVTDADFPWLNATVQALEGFEDVRPLFARELELLNQLDDDVDTWESAYGAVRAAVTLKYPDGNDVPEFLLHIDGDQAWWRWSDEPFDEEP
jgi:hypothetical protein